MKCVCGFLSMFLIGYPAAAAGYVWGAIRAGFVVGTIVYDDHEAAALDKLFREPS